MMQRLLLSLKNVVARTVWTEIILLVGVRLVKDPVCDFVRELRQKNCYNF